MSCSLFSILYCFFSIIYYSICFSLYFITRYQHNVLRVSIQALSNPFFIYHFIIYSYSWEKNCFTLSIFFSVLLLLLLLLLWWLLLLCASSKHAKQCKIWICALWYYKEELLILDIKAAEQLICSYENNLVNRDFTNIMNLFRTFVWLDKVIKFLMKSHEIRLICSIPRSECSNKYYK